MLVVVAEMLAVKSGLGFVMWDAYYFVRMDIIIAAMLSVGFAGILCDRLLLLPAATFCDGAVGYERGRGR